MEYQVLAGVDVQPTVLRFAEDLAPNMIRPVKDPKEKNCLIGQADHWPFHPLDQAQEGLE